MVFVLLIGGGADAAHFAGGQRRFEDIGCIHGAAAGGAGTDDGVDFIYEQDGVFYSFSVPVIHAFEPLFKIAPELGAGQQ